ncbi:hypothetical protein BaRGS_00025093 [Batillaria attramentaria]|uniref:Uncharacterized protein n=1 Tax=Batillaria attramentaria TaxID=370345 RepID=A0ABD0K965_9CAEN
MGASPGSGVACGTEFQTGAPVANFVRYDNRENAPIDSARQVTSPDWLEMAFPARCRVERPAEGAIDIDWLPSASSSCYA